MSGINLIHLSVKKQQVITVKALKTGHNLEF